ncbi:RimK/LysX family protein [archaeon]|nr:RimK/LysX family protein [archaeon]
MNNDNTKSQVKPLKGAKNMKEVGLVEKVAVCGKQKVDALAKFDTGAARTSVDKTLAEKVGLGPVLRTRKIKSALSKGQEREVVKAQIQVAGKSFDTEVNLSDRSHSKCKVLIGRDLMFENFVINISKEGKPPEVV